MLTAILQLLRAIPVLVNLANWLEAHLREKSANDRLAEKDAAVDSAIDAAFGVRPVEQQQAADAASAVSGSSEGRA